MTEDLKVIEEILGFGDIDYVEEDKTKAIAHFHKLKRAYEIFERKCPFVLVFTNSYYTYETKAYMEEIYINDGQIIVVEK